MASTPLWSFATPPRPTPSPKAPETRYSCTTITSCSKDPVVGLKVTDAHTFHRISIHQRIRVEITIATAIFTRLLLLPRTLRSKISTIRSVHCVVNRLAVTTHRQLSHLLSLPKQAAYRAAPTFASADQIVLCYRTLILLHKGNATSRKSAFPARRSWTRSPNFFRGVHTIQIEILLFIEGWIDGFYWCGNICLASYFLYFADVSTGFLPDHEYTQTYK